MTSLISEQVLVEKRERAGEIGGKDTDLCPLSLLAFPNCCHQDNFGTIR